MSDEKNKSSKKTVNRGIVFHVPAHLEQAIKAVPSKLVPRKDLVARLEVIAFDAVNDKVAETAETMMEEAMLEAQNELRRSLGIADAAEDLSEELGD
jgi:hypothetical protein